MGCDIHIFVEYRDNNQMSPQVTWSSLYPDAFNPGRNYELFSKLSGVRGINDNPIANPGWPKDISWSAEYANTIYVTTEEAKVGFEKRVLMSTAERWVNSNQSQWVYNITGNIAGVTNPDWHSHGWCTVEQMSKALRKNSNPAYRAMMAAARSLEKDNMEVRLLFFYDN